MDICTVNEDTFNTKLVDNAVIFTITSFNLQYKMKTV